MADAAFPTQPTGGQQWAAAGAAGGDAAYRSQTLRFGGIELNLDETVPRQALVALFLKSAFAGFLVFLVFLLISLIFGSGSSTPSYGYGYPAPASGSGSSGVFGAGAIIAVIVFFVVLLFSRTEEPIAEWNTLLDSRSQAAPSAYSAIYGTLRFRQIPVRVNAYRVRSDVLTKEVVNNRLVITDRGYVAYVSVFGYGTSLYVGWLMWRNRRGATLIGQYVKDLLGGLFGRTGSINQMLRTEKVRAMREAIHGAVREGVDAAVRGTEVPIAATFGVDLPITDIA